MRFLTSVLVTIHLVFSSTIVEKPESVIVVTGSGFYSAPADGVKVDIQISVVDETIKDGKKHIEATLNDLLGSQEDPILKNTSFRVEPTGFSMSRNMVYENQSSFQRGFSLIQNIRVTVS